MSGVATAVIGSAVLGAVVSSHSANKAVDAQKEAAATANVEQAREFDLQQKNMEPWRNTGSQALSSLAYGMGLGGSQGGGGTGTGAGSQPLTYEQWAAQQSGVGAPTVGPTRMPMTVDGVPTGRLSIVPGGPGMATTGNGAARNAAIYAARGAARRDGGDFPPGYGSRSGAGGKGAVPTQPTDGSATAGGYGPTSQAGYESYLKTFHPAASSGTPDPAFGDLNRDFTMADYHADPGYQFRLDQGNQALERSAAARGVLASGGTLKGLTDYSQGAASQEYSNAYNRFNNDRTQRFNRLSTLAGTGQTAANSMNQASQNYSSNYGANTIGAGNAASAGYMAQGNAVNSGLSTIGNYFMQRQYMNQFGGGGGGFNPSSMNIPSVPDVPQLPAGGAFSGFGS